MNLFLFLVTTAIWGSTWIAITFQVDQAPALASVFHRFAVAAALIAPALALAGRLPRLDARGHGFVALQGLFLACLNFLCFYNAARYAPSGLISVVFSLATFFNTVNARLIFGDAIRARAVIAGLIGASGVALLFWPQIASTGGANVWPGIGFATVGTLFFSLGNMVSRRNSRAGLAPVAANAWAMAYGALFTLAIALANGVDLRLPTTPSYLTALGFLAVFGSVVGFTTYLMMVARMGPGKAAYATVMFPVVGLTISTLVEGYRWTPVAAAGLVLTLIGNAVMFAPARKRAQQG
ncbi:MAG: DMT family transporter [Rhizobiales bacterium]|nr:DMT family transporter [Hyphomicrobiales bacterium]